MPVMITPSALTPRALGRRPEHDVHGRPVPVDQRAIDDLDEILRAAALEEHVASARSDQRAPGDDAVVVARLAHLDAAQAVQARREGRGELLRHVLHDDECPGRRAAAP